MVLKHSPSPEASTLLRPSISAQALLSIQPTIQFVSAQVNVWIEAPSSVHTNAKLKKLDDAILTQNPVPLSYLVFVAQGAVRLRQKSVGGVVVEMVVVVVVVVDADVLVARDVVALVVGIGVVVDVVVSGVVVDNVLVVVSQGRQTICALWLRPGSTPPAIHDPSGGLSEPSKSDKFNAWNDTGSGMHPVSQSDWHTKALNPKVDELQEYRREKEAFTSKHQYPFVSILSPPASPHGTVMLSSSKQGDSVVVGTVVSAVVATVVVERLMQGPGTH